jgi:hypothetical protein
MSAWRMRASEWACRFAPRLLPLRGSVPTTAPPRFGRASWPQLPGHLRGFTCLGGRGTRSRFSRSAYTAASPSLCRQTYFKHARVHGSTSTRRPNESEVCSPCSRVAGGRGAPRASASDDRRRPKARRRRRQSSEGADDRVLRLRLPAPAEGRAVHHRDLAPGSYVGASESWPELQRNVGSRSRIGVRTSTR